MERLFLFFYHYRAFFTFLLLEFLCIVLIVSSNHYQRAMFLNSSGSFVANLNSFSYSVSEYFSLHETNLQLAEENAELRNQLEHYQKPAYPLDLPPALADTVAVDSTMTLPAQSAAPYQKPGAATSPAMLDTTATVIYYDYISAKVVNNSVGRFTNFITIDKGSDAGVEEGMAVINHAGIVGKVKGTSRHYSVVTSLLNIDVMASAKIKRTGHFGTVQWSGKDPMYVNLKFIPPHVKPVLGDSVVTSGFNSVFPEDILIGTIEEVELNDAALFYDLKVKLSQDFRKLSYVTVVKSNLKVEQDSLEHPFQQLQP